MKGRPFAVRRSAISGNKSFIYASERDSDMNICDWRLQLIVSPVINHNVLDQLATDEKAQPHLFKTVVTE
jgi:hypothetical protein